MDGQSLGTVSNSPYTLPWTPTPGPHTASAIATDSFGTSGVSSNLQFFVAEPIFPEGSSWRVNAFGTNVPNSWRNSGYDDSRWPRLRAPLGFGYPDIRSLIPSNFNGTPIPGAVKPELILSGMQPVQGGQYSVTVSNAVGTASSSAAEVVVK